MEEPNKTPTTEERLDKLEQSAHYHRIVERLDCNPEKAEILKEAIRMSTEDKEKAKGKGKLHGDPIFIVE
jgi:hypothetical protein